VTLAPVLLATWLWRLPWWLRTPHAVEVAPGVLVGARPMFWGRGARAWSVLDLTAESSESREVRRRAAEYLNVPMLDRTAPGRQQMCRALEFIRSRVRAGQTVYVHCALGYSRSVGVAAAYLMSEAFATSSADAVRMVAGSRGRRRVDAWIVGAVSDAMRDAMRDDDPVRREESAEQPRVYGWVDDGAVVAPSAPAPAGAVVGC
jgi:hypothetical protein